MREYHTFGEIQEDETFPKEIFQEVEAFILNCKDEHLEKDNEHMENFQYSMGGNVFVIEKLEDLSEILTTEDSLLFPEELASVLETHSSFDIAEYLPSFNWVCMWMATSNSGGASYYIPKEVVNLCPNIEKCVMDTNGELKTYSIAETRKNGNH
jgi:hypothetical protein